MTDREDRGGRAIAASADLEDAGRGVRFEVGPPGTGASAFVIRWKGGVFSYVNACPHVGSELDWVPGEFFDSERQYLLCATHGAAFEPATGLCVAGPCVGARLMSVSVSEVDGRVVVPEAEAER